MSKVVIDLGVSLDGFIAGPDDDPRKVFDWYFSGDTPIPQYEDAARRGAQVPPFKLAAPDAAVFQELLDNSGAVVTGRRTYEVSNGWNGDGPHPGVPLFVVTHDPPTDVPGGMASYTFVRDGVDSAIGQAKEAAGEKWVSMLGASVAQQALRTGLVDEIRLHVAPVLLGSGVRLFGGDGDPPVELDQLDVVSGPTVTHLIYRVR
jgi:dihydrofolate reductase